MVEQAGARLMLSLSISTVECQLIDLLGTVNHHPGALQSSHLLLDLTTNNKTQHKTLNIFRWFHSSPLGNSSFH